MKYSKQWRKKNYETTGKNQTSKNVFLVTIRSIVCTKKGMYVAIYTHNDEINNIINNLFKLYDPIFQYTY